MHIQPWSTWATAVEDHTGHESMDPACPVSMVQSAGSGVRVWTIFSQHTLRLLASSEHCNTLPESFCWPHPSHYDHSVSSDRWHAPCHKAQISSCRFLEHYNELTVLQWSPQSPDLNPIKHLWDVVGDSRHGCAVTVWCHYVNIDQNLSKILLNLCHQELSQLWGQKGGECTLSLLILNKEMGLGNTCKLLLYV